MKKGTIVRMSRIIINDWLAWGRLLKTWVTGKDYFGNGKTYPRPETLEELKAQLADCGAGSVPDWVVGFELVDWDEKKLSIELPPVEVILNGEAILRSGKQYPLPAFYRTSGGELVSPDNPTAWLAFHAMRIGEHAVDAFG